MSNDVKIELYKLESIKNYLEGLNKMSGRLEDALNKISQNPPITTRTNIAYVQGYLESSKFLLEYLATNLPEEKS